MTSVASRELRNNTRALLDRVDAGEAIVITVDGRAVAELRPWRGRRRWMGRQELLDRVVARPADAGLRADLAALAPDTTDDLRPS